MRKLKLEIDALRVETFEPADRAGERAGTVRGHVFYTQFCAPSSPEACPSVYTGNDDCFGCQYTGGPTCWDCPDDTGAC